VAFIFDHIVRRLDSIYFYHIKMPKDKSFKRHNQNSASSNDGNSKDNSHTVRTLLTPNTSIGQHFLKNPAIVDSIVAKSYIQKSDIVLEVGPGTGNLTVRLLDQAKRVIAVEFDRRMVSKFIHTYANLKSRIIICSRSILLYSDS